MTVSSATRGARAVVGAGWPLLLAAATARRHARRDPRRMHLADLEAYRVSAGEWLRGGDPYNVATGKGFLFVYPPFTLLACAPLAGIRLDRAGLVWNAIGITAVQTGIRCTLTQSGVRGARAWSVPLVAAATRFGPMDQALHLGQISPLLTGLVVGDLALSDRSPWKGTLIGLATGLKMVPGIFVPHLVLESGGRAGARSVLVAAATVAIGAAAMPEHARAFWTRYAYDANRVIPVHWPPNESLRAMIVRLRHSVPGSTAPWLAACAITLAAAAATVAGSRVLGERGAAMTATALAGLLVSPVSHHHYWVWLVPTTIRLCELARRTRSAPLLAAAAAPLAVLATRLDQRSIPGWTPDPDPMIALSPRANAAVNSLTVATALQLAVLAGHVLRRARHGRG